jgi:DNA-binding CsgD family transcriptional regulator
VRDLTEILQPLTFSMRTRLLMGEIQVERSNFETALGMLPSPACVLSNAGMVLFANQAALSLFVDGSDVRLKADGELRLRISGITSSSAFSEMLAAGFAKTGKTFLASRSNGKRPLVCTLTPLSGYETTLGLVKPKYMLIISDPEAAPALPSVSFISSYLSLSPAEARIALEMTKGGRTADIAKRLILSPNTVRNHISAVFAKTGCENQSDVAKIILSLGRIDSTQTL